MSLEKFIAKKNPEIIWIIKQIPNNDPKFHIYEMFEGEGRLIKGFKSFNIGYKLFIGEEIQFKFFKITSKVTKR